MDDRRVYGPVPPTGLTKKELQAWLYKARKEAGICTRCGKAKAVSGHVLCWQCKAHMRDKYIEQTLTETEEQRKERLAKSAERYRKRYERLKTAGLCVTCGKRPAEPGHTRCEACRKRINARGKEKRIQKGEYKGYAELGLCRICGKQVVDGYSYCPEHLKKAQEKAARMWSSRKAKEARERKKRHESAIIQSIAARKEAAKR